MTHFTNIGLLGFFLNHKEAHLGVRPFANLGARWYSTRNSSTFLLTNSAQRNTEN